jgi:hypothetical protein
MAACQEEHIKQLVRKRKVFRRELEMFQAALNNYEGGSSVTAIQHNLEDLEKEYAAFKETQCDLDDMDDSQTMQERLDLKHAFYTCKEHALYIINNANTQIGQTIKSNKPNSPGTSGAIGRQTLETRCDQTAKIVARHLKGLLDVAPLQRSSYRDLQSYVTKVEAHYNALQALGQPTVDTMLLYLFTSKLDRETRLRWKERTKNTTFPTVAEFLQFLNQRCDILEPRVSTRYTRERPFITSQSPSSCLICRGPHGIWSCNIFKVKAVRERLIAANKVSASTNCPNRGRVFLHCTAGSCHVCGQRHH